MLQPCFSFIRRLLLIPLTGSSRIPPLWLQREMRVQVLTEPRAAAGQQTGLTARQLLELQQLQPLMPQLSLLKHPNSKQAASSRLNSRSSG